MLGRIVFWVSCRQYSYYVNIGLHERSSSTAQCKFIQTQPQKLYLVEIVIQNFVLDYKYL